MLWRRGGGGPAQIWGPRAATLVALYPNPALARTCATPSSPASLTSAASRAAPMTLVVSHAAPSTPPVPHATPTSMTPTVPPMVPTSQPYLLHYSRRPRATRKSLTPPLHQQSSPAKAVPVAPLVNPHPMTTRGKLGFRLPANRLTLSATSASTLSLVPSFVRAALVDLNWRRTMQEEFVALIINNT
jgi:hypothetical protein